MLFLSLLLIAQFNYLHPSYPSSQDFQDHDSSFFEEEKEDVQKAMRALLPQQPFIPRPGETTKRPISRLQHRKEEKKEGLLKPPAHSTSSPRTTYLGEEVDEQSMPLLEEFSIPSHTKFTTDDTADPPRRIRTANPSETYFTKPSEDEYSDDFDASTDSSNDETNTPIPKTISPGESRLQPLHQNKKCEKRRDAIQLTSKQVQSDQTEFCVAITRTDRRRRGAAITLPSPRERYLTQCLLAQRASYDEAESNPLQREQKRTLSDQATTTLPDLPKAALRQAQQIPENHQFDKSLSYASTSRSSRSQSTSPSRSIEIDFQEQLNRYREMNHRLPGRSDAYSSRGASTKPPARLKPL